LAQNEQTDNKQHLNMHDLPNSKETIQKYGLLPEKEAEAMPWDRLCINLISPYNMKSNIKGVKIPPLKCITMINLATGCLV
jgi:hypothetical protein